MRCASVFARAESKRHSSTFVAFSEKSAKFTPPSMHVAPRGEGRPGQTRMGLRAAPAGDGVAAAIMFLRQPARLRVHPHRIPSARCDDSLSDFSVTALRPTAHA